MSNTVKTGPISISIGKQGRIVIPAALRQSLDISEGDKLVACEEDGRLVIEKPEAVTKRIRALFAHIPEERSLVDELILERREAARKEIAE